MDKYNMRNHAIYDECSVSNGNYLYHVFSLPSPSRCSFSAFPLCDPSNGFAGNIRSSQFYQYLSSPCVFPNVPSTLYQPGQEKSRFASEQPLSLIPGPSCFIPPHPMPAIQPVVIQSPHCSNFDNTLQISEMFKVSKNNQFNDKGNLESIKEAEWAKVEQLVHMFHAADKTKSKPTTIYVEDLERIIFRELIDKESQKIKFGKLKIESLERTKVKVENLKENKIELETIHKENKVKTEIESPKHQETKVTKIKVENSEGGEIKIKDWMEETQKKGTIKLNKI
ncbi:uncharacterized protein LOC114255008 [Monomorium pharaonis]|uniref:uncharacterized protein LOC114255008 n=1 Tax=Monomorium pharaonis TaxID=307658 RepID=UPI00102E1E4F|nr:uncharacterized protein LOC114255008 [Monomorium pharaonis]